MEVPRQYSVDDDLLLPDGDRIGRLLRITVGGVPIKHAISYDIDRGEVVRLVVDRNGNFLINRAAEEFMTQTVHGHVEVTIDEGADA